MYFPSQKMYFHIKMYLPYHKIYFAYQKCILHIKMYFAYQKCIWYIKHVFCISKMYFAYQKCLWHIKKVCCISKMYFAYQRMDIYIWQLQYYCITNQGGKGASQDLDHKIWSTVGRSVEVPSQRQVSCDQRSQQLYSATGSNPKTAVL